MRAISTSSDASWRTTETRSCTSSATTARLRRTISAVEAFPCPASGRKAITGRGVHRASRTVTPAPYVSRVAMTLGIDAPIQHVANPRVESETHYCKARSSKLIDLGLEPHMLDDATVIGLLQDAIHHRDHIRLDTRSIAACWRY